MQKMRLREFKYAPKGGNYHITIHEKVYKRIKDYKKKLEQGEEKAGKYLLQASAAYANEKNKENFNIENEDNEDNVKAFWAGLKLDEFIKLLLLSKQPHFDSESELNTDTDKWTSQEHQLLRNISYSMPGMLYQAGGRNLGEARAPYKTPIPIQLHGAVAPLMVTGSDDFKLVMQEISEDNKTEKNSEKNEEKEDNKIDNKTIFKIDDKKYKFNYEKYKEILDQRFKIGLLEFVENAKTKKTKKLCIKVPVVGGGYFAGDWGKQKASFPEENLHISKELGEELTNEEKKLLQNNKNHVVYKLDHYYYDNKEQWVLRRFYSATESKLEKNAIQCNDEIIINGESKDRTIENLAEALAWYNEKPEGAFGQVSWVPIRIKQYEARYHGNAVANTFKKYLKGVLESSKDTIFTGFESIQVNYCHYDDMAGEDTEENINEKITLSTKRLKGKGKQGKDLGLMDFAEGEIGSDTMVLGFGLLDGSALFSNELNKRGTEKCRASQEPEIASITSCGGNLTGSPMRYDAETGTACYISENGSLVPPAQALHAKLINPFLDADEGKIFILGNTENLKEEINLLKSEAKKNKATFKIQQLNENDLREINTTEVFENYVPLEVIEKQKLDYIEGKCKAFLIALENAIIETNWQTRFFGMTGTDVNIYLHDSGGNLKKAVTTTNFFGPERKEMKYVETYTKRLPDNLAQILDIISGCRKMQEYPFTTAYQALAKFFLKNAASFNKNDAGLFSSRRLNTQLAYYDLFQYLQADGNNEWPENDFAKGANKIRFMDKSDKSYQRHEKVNITTAEGARSTHSFTKSSVA